MAYDGDSLWWYGFAKHRHVDVEGGAAEIIKKTGKQLIQGSLFFKRPEDIAEKIMAGEQKVKLRGKDRKLSPKTKSAVTSISTALNLNQIQSYCLLKQWAKYEKMEGEPPTLDNAQLQQVQEFYSRERHALLKLIVELLRIPEEGDDEEVQEIVKDWVTKDLQENMHKSLVQFLSNPAGPRTLAANDPGVPTTLDETELGPLLDALLILYKVFPATPSQLKGLVTALCQYTQDSISPISPPLLTKVCCLFMLVLDLPGMVELSREDVPPSVDHKLADSLKDIDAEVHLFFKCKDPMAGGLVLIWAVFLESYRESNSGGDPGLDASQYLERFGPDQLFSILQTILSGAAGFRPADKHEAHSYVLTLVDAVIWVGESLEKNRSALQVFIRLVVNIMDGDNALAQEVMRSQQFSGIRRLIGWLRNWFPAFASPLLRVLAAMAGGAATEQLLVGMDHIQTMSVVHAIDDPDLQIVDEDMVVSRTEIPISDAANGIANIPRGTEGFIVKWPDLVGEDMMLVKWERPVSLMDYMGMQFSKFQSMSTLRPLSDKDKVEMMDFIRFFKRVMDYDGWQRVFHYLSCGLNLDAQHSGWMVAVRNCCNVFAKGRKIGALADGLSILASYAVEYPNRVLAIVTDSALLGPVMSSTQGLHITSFLSDQEENLPDKLNLLIEFVNLITTLVKEAVTGPAIQFYVTLITEKILPNLQSWGRIDVIGAATLACRVLQLIAYAVNRDWTVGRGKLGEHIVDFFVNNPGVLDMLLSNTLPPSVEVVREQQALVNPAALVANLLMEVMIALLSPNCTDNVRKTVALTLLEAPAGRNSETAACILMSYVALPPSSLESQNVVLTSRKLVFQFLASLTMAIPLLPKNSAPVSRMIMSSNEDTDDVPVHSAFFLAFQPKHAKSRPDIFAAAVDLLVAATEHHHVLLDVLLFPTNLDGKSEEKDDSQGSESEKKGPQSCVNGLVHLVEMAKQLVINHPQVLYDCCRALRCLWINRQKIPAPPQLLTKKDSFWSRLGQALKYGNGDKPSMFRTGAQSLILEIFSLESMKGGALSGARSEIESWLNVSNGKECWMAMREQFGLCDYQEDTFTDLYSAAQCMALQMVYEADREERFLESEVHFPLLDKLKKDLDPTFEGISSHSKREEALLALARECLRDPTARVDRKADPPIMQLSNLASNPGFVLLEDLNEKYGIWDIKGAGGSTYTPRRLGFEEMGYFLPTFCAERCNGMKVLVDMVNDVRSYHYRLHHKSTCLKALHHLIIFQLNKPHPSNPLTQKSLGKIVQSTSKSLTPWMHLSKSNLPTESNKNPSHVRTQIFPVQMKAIQMCALEISSGIAMGLSVFVRMWCSELPVAHHGVSTSRDLSLTPEAGRVRRGSIVKDPGNMPDAQVLADCFVAMNAFFAEVRELEGWWHEKARDIAESMLAALSAILSNYPFQYNENRLRTFSGDSKESMEGTILPVVCWLGNPNRTGPELSRTALSVLRVLLGFDVWNGAMLLTVRDDMDIDGLLMSATEAIPSFDDCAEETPLPFQWYTVFFGFCVDLANHPSAYSLLSDPDTLRRLIKHGKRLLAWEGGGKLGSQPKFGPPDKSRLRNTDVERILSVNFWGAYLPDSRKRRVAHEHWVMFLEIISVLMAANEVTFWDCQFLYTPIQYAIAVPNISHQEPLTLGRLLETQHAFTLLRGMTASPENLLNSQSFSLRSFREAAAAFINYSAMPFYKKASINVICPPISSEEKQMALCQPPAVTKEGWFGLFNAGQSVNLDGAHGEDFVNENAGNGQVDVPRTVSKNLARVGSTVLRRMSGSVSLDGRPSLGYLGDIGLQQQSQDNGQQVKGSAYSFRLGLHMYMSIHGALLFLTKTSPHAIHSEVDNLGPTWPDVQALLVVREHCLALAVDLAHVDTVEVCDFLRFLRESIDMSTEFLGVLGHVPKKREVDRLKKRVGDLDRLLLSHGH